MKIISTLAIVLFFCLPALASTVYVANEGNNTVAVITIKENESGEIQEDKKEEISLGNYAPHNLIVSEDGKLLYVTANAHGDSHHGARLFKIDLTDLTQTYFESHGHFAHVTKDPSRDRLFVTDTSADRVLVIEEKTLTIQDTIKTGKGPHGLKFHQGKNKLYVANMGGDSITEIDVKDKISRQIKTGLSPVQIALSATGDRVYATLFKDQKVAVVDAAKGHVQKYIAAKNSPVQIEESKNGKWLVVAEQGTKESPGNTILIVDTQRLDTVRHVDVGLGPHGVALNQNYAFITNLVGESLSVVDLALGKEVLRVDGLADPNGIAVGP